MLTQLPSEEHEPDLYGDELRAAFAVVLHDVADCLRAFGNMVVAEAENRAEEPGCTRPGRRSKHADRWLSCPRLFKECCPIPTAPTRADFNQMDPGYAHCCRDRTRTVTRLRANNSE